jgi:hypothetical protein
MRVFADRHCILAENWARHFLLKGCPRATLKSVEGIAYEMPRVRLNKNEDLSLSPARHTMAAHFSIPHTLYHLPSTALCQFPQRLGNPQGTGSAPRRAPQERHLAEGAAPRTRGTGLQAACTMARPPLSNPPWLDPLVPLLVPGLFRATLRLPVTALDPTPVAARCDLGLAGCCRPQPRGNGPERIARAPNSQAKTGSIIRAAASLCSLVRF